MMGKTEIIGRYIEIGSYRVHYESAGEGRAIVCIPTAGATVVEYRSVLPYLADMGYRGIALDIPGHGNSLPNLNDLSMPSTEEEFVDIIWQFSQKMNLQQPVFMGFAMSGSALLLMGILHGEEVGAIVAGEANAECRMDPVQLASLNHPGINTADMMTVTTPGLCGVGSSNETINECIWHNARNVVPEAIQMDLSIYDTHNVTGRLAEIKCPVLHTYGEYDYTVSNFSKEKIRTMIPRVKQVCMKGNGHYVPMENPEGLCRELKAFFEEFLMEI